MRVAIFAVAAVLMTTTAAFAQMDMPSMQTVPETTEPAAQTPTAPPAGDQQTPAATDGQQGEQAEDPVICRTQQTTETRLSRRRTRICHTRSEWESMQDRASRELNRAGQTAITRD